MKQTKQKREAGWSNSLKLAPLNAMFSLAGINLVFYKNDEQECYTACFTDEDGKKYFIHRPRLNKLSVAVASKWIVISPNTDV